MARSGRSSGERVWRTVWDHLARDLDLRGWILAVLMAVWLCLNVFDLLITYDGLAAGAAYEANRMLAGIIRRPALAVPLKMGLAYLLLKVVERVETRTPYSGLAPLLVANLYLSWACLHNLHVMGGVGDWSQFLHYYPLVGLPR
jgi:hypothetical protein